MNLRTRLLAAPIGALIATSCTSIETSAAPMMMSAPKAPSPQAGAALVSKLAGARATWGLDSNHGFMVALQHPGVQGTQVVRAAHTYKGLRVFGSESVVVLDASGAIVSEAASSRRLHLGRGPSNRLGASTADFNVKPAMPAKAAIDNAVAAAGAGRGASHIVPPRAELLIYPVMKMERVPAAAAKLEAELNALDVEEVVDHYELAYLVRTRMRRGDRPLYYDTVVSARDGHVIDRWNALQTVIGVGKSQYNGEVPVSTTQAGDTFQMRDPERGTGGAYGAMAITNANNTSSAGKVYTNTTNTWGDGKQYIRNGSTTDANGQTAAVNAMWGLMNTYDALKNALGWQSLDGQNTATYIAVHVNRAYDNAYYSDTCRCMFIGDGSSFTSLGAIDVIGHEMNHGVTAATSDLVYSGESGGLNESSSDIGGEVAEAYARAGGKGEAIPASGNDWMLGTEINPRGEPLRWMYRPSKDGSSPDAWSTSLRRLDVHYSSGPNNRMFYFLAQGSKAEKDGDYYSKYLVKSPQAMTGIGLDAAFRIWFKANTTKFTSSTNYADARAKMIEAAQELYGAASREAIAVQRAYAAINVGADVDELTTQAPPPATSM